MAQTITVSAAVFTLPEAPLEIKELNIDTQLGAREVLVKLVASGVCHSDLHVISGDWDTPAPIVLGHEGAGVIEQIGTDVDGLAVGDHVILSWTPACGRCEFCVAGRPVLCETANRTAYQHTLPDGRPRLSDGDQPVKSFLGAGTFGTYAVVPDSAAIRIRKDAPFAQAALVGCAVTTGIGAVTNTARVEAGSTVLVIGAGGVGLNIVQGARLVGAKQIIVADRAPGKLQLASGFGATDTIDAGARDTVAEVMRLTEGRGVDYAFEAIGLAPTIEQCYAATRRGGTTVVVGQVGDGVTISIDPFVMSDQEKRIIGSNYGSSRQSIDFPKIIDLYMEGRIDLDSMITARIPLSAVNEAFDEMRRGEGIRTVIEF